MLNLHKFAFVAVFLILIGGCSAGDVQLEGKIFDALGVSDALNSRPEPKLKARAPIVMPPDAQLPEPGKRVVAKHQDHQWPDDPDERARKKIADAELERKKYCEGPGTNRYDPDYDIEKAAECGLLSKVINNTFGRAEEKTQP